MCQTDIFALFHFVLSFHSLSCEIHTHPQKLATVKQIQHKMNEQVLEECLNRLGLE